MFPVFVRGLQVLVSQHCSFEKASCAVEQNWLFYILSFFFVQLADINECSMPNKCQNGKCINTEGSYTCECKTGYSKSGRGLCEGESHASAQPFALRVKFTQRHNYIYSSNLIYLFASCPYFVCSPVTKHILCFSLGKAREKFSLAPWQRDCVY